MTKFLKYLLLPLIAFLPLQCLADLHINTPGSNNTILAATSDYATEVLNNPWDFSDSSDLANYVDSADKTDNFQIANGKLTMTGNGHFTLLAPGMCSAMAMGKVGQNFPIDTTKYRYLTLRMYNASQSAFQILVNTQCNYSDGFWQSVQVNTVPGWHTYTVDMQTLGHQFSNGYAPAWNATNALGLRIDPTIAGSTVEIDWITLTAEPPTGTSIGYTFSPGTGNKAHSVFLDEDADPTNGYEKALAVAQTSQQNITVDSGKLLPGKSFFVSGVEGNDFASLQLDPWDMHQSSDIALLSGMVYNFDNGVFSATTVNSDQQDKILWMNLHGENINASVFKYLQLGLSISQGNFGISWAGTSCPSGCFQSFSGSSSRNINMSQFNGWSGSVRSLGFSFDKGVSLQLASVALRNDGFGTYQSNLIPVVSPGQIKINQPPLISVVQPDAAGGEDFASHVLNDPWNMDTTTDMQIPANESNPRILPNNSIGGQQGDYYAGTSINGNFDPNQHSLVEPKNRARMADARIYKNLSFKMLIDRQQDINAGSVARIIWKSFLDGPTTFYNSEDIITFNGWHEYIQDMSKIRLEELQHPDGSYPNPPWRDFTTYFRVDPHEFSSPTSFFFDYIRLTADDEANGRFAFVFDAADSDTAAKDVTVGLYIQQQPQTTNGTLLGQMKLSDGNVMVVDTSSFAEGSYYIYAKADDGVNSTSRLATGKLTINHQRDTDGQAPALVLDNPTNGANVYDSLVVSGYALDNIQLARVEARVDGAFVGSFGNGRFDSRAQDNYRTWSESGNAGFRSTLNLSSVRPGNRTLELRAYDTAGNITTVSVPVVKQSGGDPSPYPEPAPSDAAALPVGSTTGGGGGGGGTTPGQTPVVLSLKLKSTKNTLTFTVTGASRCSRVNVAAATSEKNMKAFKYSLLRDAPAGKDKVVFKGTKVRPGISKRKGINVYFAARCDTATASKISKFNTGKFVGRVITSASSWVSHIKSVTKPSK